MQKATVKDLFKCLDTAVPLELAEKWDNCGLQAGSYDWPATKILVALDVSTALMKKAADWGADVVLTHHPLMIQSLKQMDFGIMPGSAVALSAARKISIISLHTNLDKAQGGLNDRFARMLGLQKLTSLQRPQAGSESTPDDPGVGRIGALSAPMPLTTLAKKVKHVFKAEYVRMVGAPDLSVATVAVCTGSGESLLPDVFRAGVQAYITGDMKYHAAREAQDHGLGIIDVGHFASEQIAVDLLKETVESFSNLGHFIFEVKDYREESDPFVIQ